ncbi:leucyl aminopeptidase [Mycena rosella]|uniref:Aminopeptidase n=1 Tax=Mycena rosella TaxID=1033263 RepID=A0AAD7DLK4_MYCRO|nr:leucyl aminopeptidase [Mycena rosella]
MSPDVQDKYRLPVNVQPTHYDVTLWTDLKTLKFGGFLELGTASIHSDVLQSEHLQSGQIIDKEMQRVTFTFPSALPAGSKAQLKVAFNSPLRASMTGYYRSSWEEDGHKKHYALTQFEATDARSAFPCWDEPLLKATFAITMVSHADTVNLSNMPAISEKIYEPGSNETIEMGKLLSSLSTEQKWKITQFETTPKMSSYIVAFANGPFVHREQKVVMPLSGKTLPLRIYSTPDVIHQADFALDVAARVIPLYETVFDVEYPLPKLDTLVNWGLITGRTSSLLLDPAKADINAKKNVAMTQSHEVAHMWFGNVVTMKWWDNLYLNEGFATLMGEVIIIKIQSHETLIFILPRIFPEWKANSEFISDHLQSALALDAKHSSHPIEVDCPDANHISQIFDALSYSKAASVLRMLCDYVGEEKFLKGVSLYLKNNLFGNTVTNDLFEGISAATGVDTVRLMDHWIKKIGYPVLTVTEGPNGIHVRQDRFIETGQTDPKENETIWNVPLSILTADSNGHASIDRTAILEEREKDIALDTSGTFKINAGTVGFFRTLYTPERLAKIAAEASKENSVFTLDDRMGILYDVMALSKAGFAKVSDTLTVIDLWSNEKECELFQFPMWLGISSASFLDLVLSSVSDTLSAFVSTFSDSPKTVEILRAFIRSLFVPIVKRLGYEYSADDPTDVILLRTKAIAAALTGKDQGVIDELKGRFAYYMQTGDDSRIPADLQSVIFVAAVKYGGPAEYAAIQKIQEKPKTPTARIAAIYALGTTEDSALLERTFSSIADARDNEIVYFLRGLQSNVLAKRKLAAYFKDHYDSASFAFIRYCTQLTVFQLMKRFEGNFTITHLVSVSFGALSTKEDYASIEEFFKDKDTSKYSMALAQTMETIRTRIAYIERSSADLNEWLEKWDKRS